MCSTALRRTPRSPWRARCHTALATALVVLAAMVPTASLSLLARSAYAVAPEGAGFNLNAGDLRFILKQIKIAERHAATFTEQNFQNPACEVLRGTGPHQVPNPLLPFGLRTVDGSCNNLVPGQEDFGAAHRVMPRLAAPAFRDAEPMAFDPDGPGPAAAGDPTTYDSESGLVFDARPRMVSNLIVDQTSTNPAAVRAAAEPPRSFFSEPSAVPCTAPDTPDGCTPDGQTLLIPNISTDGGLSPPFNSWFTLFGQFFDHGLDFTVKGGSGTVMVPLRDGDPLVPGPDRRLGTPDDLPPQLRFMVLTRARNLPGPDGRLGTDDDVHDTMNTDTPWVDQNQTYTSHPAHQVFLRAYENNVAGVPVSTGKLIEGERGGMATWGEVKQQAAHVLGIRLSDADVLNVPLLAVDPYGRFLPGPNGFPQIVTTTGLAEGNTQVPVAVPSDALRTGVAFLDDIAHHAAPRPGLIPDVDTTATAAFAAQPTGTYDDEMLDAHFISGDGRINENIGLTAVHQIFHSEHNRLAGDENNEGTIKYVLTHEDPQMVPEWKLPDGTWNGERIFAAARFVNEMEYQHLAFEEFARKVQPGLDLFSGVQSDIDAAINAEFAHAVYRFGHSMLTDTIARTNADGTTSDIPLLQGFLNPLEYTDGGVLTPEQAAGSIVMGMSDQAGNEIDEFVTETLRSNLLGLPLDLAAINITRGRDTGVPPLNDFRRKLFASTRDVSLRPYVSWSDFGLNLKHAYSLVNFMAAYGTHPSIADANTLTDRREAARLIYDNDPVLNPGTPSDAGDFLDSTGSWANQPTGLEDVDLWVGGLAETTELFGGMLGTTFGYVFEQQMAKLQDGDRFYYLARLAGLNLLSEIEGNSFAEMVMRNTDATALKADVFSTADCEFELANLGTSGPISDDPDSACDESLVLTRMADGTIRYRQMNTVDPPGINPQSTYNGTTAGDRVWGGTDDDTFWGNEGDDRIEGDRGDDGALGGIGDDIITDIGGADVLKGGRGDDAIDAGPGLDVVIGGLGSDFTLGGVNANETFAGPGDDLISGGGAADTVLGDGGDDWVEGGAQTDELAGDSAAPFFDDLNTPGDDVLFGQGGDDVYDAEGGDDVMVAGPGIDRNAGLRGFDWVTHVGDSQPADADLKRVLAALPPPVVDVHDRYGETEALSGWVHDDMLRGDDTVPALAAEPGQPPDSHVLTSQGIDNVTGLRTLLPAGTTSFGAGNIILGGSGSDVIEGRGGDDVIDGDAWLDVRLSVRSDRTDPATEIRAATSMADLYADVFAGTLDPADIVIVREIVSDPTAGDVDTAVFSDVLANYAISTETGVTTVRHIPPVVPDPPGDGDDVGDDTDGTDTLTNIERFVFADAILPSPPDSVSVTATADDRSATVTWTGPGVLPATGFEVRWEDASGDARVLQRSAGARRVTLTGLTNGHTYQFQVRALDANATVNPRWAIRSNAVIPAAPPGPPTIGTATRRNSSALVRWTPPSDTGGLPVTGYVVEVVGTSGDTLATHEVDASASSMVVPGLSNGQTYRFRVAAVTAAGSGAFSSLSNAVTPATVPAAPVIRRAFAGQAGGVLTTATARWAAPPSDGGAAIAGYVVHALRMSSTGPEGVVLSRTRSAPLPAAARSRTLSLRPGVYRFEVVARNAVGNSPRSARSNAVRAR